MTVRERGKDCEAIFAALPVRSAAPVRLRGAAGKADPALSMEKPAVLFYSPMACSVSLHPIYYDETVAVRAAMQKYRTSSGDAGEKTGGSATVTINGIQITGAYTDSDDGCDTYKAAGRAIHPDGGRRHNALQRLRRRIQCAHGNRFHRRSAAALQGFSGRALSVCNRL